MSKPSAPVAHTEPATETPPVRSGPVLIAYDGTRASEAALREAAALLADPSRRALAVAVVKPGLAFELIESPTLRLGLPPATVDMRTALEVEQRLTENAEAAVQRAAALVHDFGLEAEGLVVAEDPEITVSETLCRLARERDAQVLVVGEHGHGPLLGSTARAVIKEAPCPVLVVRHRGADR